MTTTTIRPQLRLHWVTATILILAGLCGVLGLHQSTLPGAPQVAVLAGLILVGLAGVRLGQSLVPAERV